MEQQTKDALIAAMMQPGAQRQDLQDLNLSASLQEVANLLMGAGAGVAGLPVDLATTAMRPFGYDVPSEDIIGSTDYFGKMMGADTESGPFVAGTFGSPDPMDAARMSTHMNDILQAMTVFHGSPHKWNKVDLSKVGTGEGAQAYGHGFYVAENPKVAKEYSLAGEFTSGEDVAKWKGIPEEQVNDWWRSMDDNARDELMSEYRRQSGNFYELDLPDETIDKMLDWDAPLSEQPERVQRALRDFIDSRPGDFPSETESYFSGNDPLTGERLYKILTQRSGDNMRKASAELEKLGIPGIKYLDGTSRSAGKGSRNFVVFDEDAITPLKRNDEAIK